MTKKRLFLITLLVFIISTQLLIANDSDRQYKIKAGFLYKFLLFIQWPENEFSGHGDQVVIAIYGANPFGNIFDMIDGMTVNGKKLHIIYLEKTADQAELTKCHILFVSASLEEKFKQILSGLGQVPVLTVSEASGFLESGGMINFVMKENKVSFEINKKAADNAGLKIRSKLLRVATRVVE